MAWDWLRQGGPVSNTVGGALDFFTLGATDFDGRGKGDSNLFSPWGGGSDGKWGPEPSEPGFGFGDAIDAFTKGYAGQSSVMGSSPTSSGQSFLSAYRPQASPSSSGSSAVMQEGGGFSGTLGDDVAFFQPSNIYLRDNPDPPVYNYYGSGSSGGGSAKGPSTGDRIKSGIIDLGKAFLTKTIFGLCDIRTKTDISPLEMTEVNDDLAQVAFFVKELRECS